MNGYKYLKIALCILSVGACSTGPKLDSDEGDNGFLTVNAIPWGQVSLDGKAVGTTPVIKYKLKPGEHELEITRNGFETHREEILVSHSQTVVISIKLTDLR